MPQPYTHELTTALEAVRLASGICRTVQTEMAGGVLTKEDASPVTIADYASQAVICRAIALCFPDDPIIGEEDATALRQKKNSGFVAQIQRELTQVGIEGETEDVLGWIDRGGSEQYSQRFWTLDPIDGTKGFVRGDQFAISLALIEKGEIKVGVLGCPNLPQEHTTDQTPSDNNDCGTLLFAVRGQGARQTGIDNDSQEREIHVTQTQLTEQARFCESYESAHSSHGRSARAAEIMGITRPPLRIDSQAKYAVVARGEADIYLRLPARKGYSEKIWDHAGGVLVVEEAGGKVTDLEGDPLNWTHGRTLATNRGVIVTNGPLHERVLEIVEATAREQST